MGRGTSQSVRDMGTCPVVVLSVPRYRLTVRDTHFAHVEVTANSKAKALAFVRQLDGDGTLPDLEFYTGDRFVMPEVEIVPESVPPNEDDIPY